MKVLQYREIRIYASESVHWRGKPLEEAVVEHVRGLKSAVRCMALRGTEGCYESGETASGRVEVLSYNMPVLITIVGPAPEIDAMLPAVVEMVGDGVVAVQDLQVVRHRTPSRLIPKHIRVRDVMTPSPKTVAPATPLHEIASLLLSSIFTGAPVVDEDGCPVGVVTQGDLIYKGGLPVRLGLLALSEKERACAALDAMPRLSAAEVMTRPAVTIEEDAQLEKAVEKMLHKSLKRLPVTDKDGKLVGMLSRLDVFRTIMKETPEWKSFRGLDIQVDNLRFASDVMRRDAHSVLPDAPMEEVLRIIDDNDIQRVAVVDQEGRFLGVISDEDLLAAFSEHCESIWSYLARKLPFREPAAMKDDERASLGARLREKTAGEVMRTNVATIREDASIDEAIRIITEKALHRIAVLDENDKFKGMVSRDSLLRTGFSC